VRRMVVIWCAAFVATGRPLSAQTCASGTSVEDAMQNTPLLVARQNLLLARSRVAERQYSEAIPPLLTTAEALAFFEEKEIGRYDGFGGDAGDTRQQILDYAAGIETDNAYALSDIDGWLDQIRQWNERRKTVWPPYQGDKIGRRIRTAIHQ
jgi:hypothetical protein